jgi:hypothetical protein
MFMKKIGHLIVLMMIILSSCVSEKPSAADKNFAIIKSINLSQISKERMKEQEKFNREVLSRLPSEFISEIGTGVVKNLHLVCGVDASTTMPIPSYRLEISFKDRQSKEFEFGPGKVLYQGTKHELFGVLIDSISYNLYKAIVKAQCHFIKENSNKVPHTISEDI